MDRYVWGNQEEQFKIHKKFTGPIKHLSDMALLDKYGKDGFTDAEYKTVRSTINRRLLSTNKEVFPTIPKQWKELIP